MKSATFPDNETLRVEKLKSYEVLDTKEEACFDQITQAAAMLCGTKIALVSLIDDKRQWFKSKYGLDATETPRDISFCGHAIMGDEIFIVENAEFDERFCENPLFINAPHVRFYAGVPLVTPEKLRIGTLCVIDSESKKLNDSQKFILKVLAANVVEILELRIKNKKLNILEDQYLDVQKMVHAGGWELDAKSGLLNWSDQIYDIFQLSKGTIADMSNSLSYYPPRERERLNSLIDSCLNEKISFDEKFEFVDAKGKKKWVHSIGRPVLDEKGNVIKINGTFQDISKQMEKERDLQLVLSNITEGFFDWHLISEYEYLSPRFWEILGYDPKTKKHHPSEWQKLIHPKDEEQALLNFDQHVKSKGEHPFLNDIRYMHANGSYVWIRCQGKVIEWSESGKPIRMVGTYTDIHLDKILNQENLVFKQALNAYAIIAKTDANGIITNVNDIFCKISKYTTIELVGQNHRILNSGHHPKSFYKELWKTILEKRTWRGEIKNRAKDGSFYWVDTTIVPILGVDGEVEGYLSYRYEITQKKEADTALMISENKHRQIFQQSKDAMVTLEAPSWKFTSANPAALAMFAIETEQDFLQLGLWSLSPEKQPDGSLSADGAKEMISLALENGSHLFEWSHMTLQGKEIPTKILLSKITEENKFYIQGVIRDISKEKELEQKITQTNKYLDLAVEGANLGIWDWDLRDNTVTYSEKWATLRGLTLNELNMDLKDWESRIHPENLLKSNEKINNYLSGKTTYFEDVHRVKHKNGNWIHILGRGRFSAWDKNGKPTRFTGTDFEVSELMSSKNKLDLFFAKAPYGFSFCLMDGSFIEINAEMERITGNSKDEFNKFSFWDLLPDKIAQEQSQLESLFINGSFGPLQKDYIKKNGELVPITINGFIVEDYDGKKGIWSIIEDVSHKVKLENEKNILLDKYQSLNQRLETIFEFSPVVVYECLPNKNWSMNYISSHIEVLTGYRPEVLVNDESLSFGNLIHPEDSSYVEDVIYSAIKDNKSYDIHYRMIHKNGDSRWVWERGAKVPGGNNLIGVIFDVTDKKFAEDEMRKVSIELNKFFDLALNYLCIVDFNQYFKKINSAWLNLGYTEEELKSQPFSNLIHPDDLEATNQEFEKLAQGQKTINFENRYRKKDGRYIHFDWSASPDVEMGQFYAVATDITERKKREEITLLVSHVRSRFIELSTDKNKFFYYLLDKILELTDSEYGFIGQILEDKSGKYLKTLALTDISWDEESKSFFQKNAPRGIEFRNLDTLFGEVIKTGKLLMTNDAKNHPKASGLPKGHPPLHSFMGVPIYYNDVLFAMVAVANKKDGFFHEDYEHLKPFFEICGELTHSVQLSHELDNQKKITAHQSKLASIGELAAGVGHEINNPLSIIQGQTEMLQIHLKKNDISDEYIASKIDKTLKSVERIANIVKGLRTFARSDEVELCNFNIQEMILETVNMLSEIYRKDEIQLLLEVEDSLWVHGNRGRLQQVIVNLLNNARDAIEKMELKIIEIHARKFNDQIKISINDSGPGIPLDLREKIFDPFFTTKEVNKGTGIGLALATTILKEHQGSLIMDNTFSTGASFVLSLPAVSQNPAIPQVHAKTQVKAQLSGTVLIVDDEDGIREILQFQLEKFGVQVLSAINGQEALDILSKNIDKIDLIISDMKMPEMNGPELAHCVRKLPAYRGGFIFITGGINSNMEEYKDLIDGILPKPFTSLQIFEAIKKWVKVPK